MLDNSKIYNYLLLLPNSKAKWTVFSFIFIFYSSLKSVYIYIYIQKKKNSVNNFGENFNKNEITINYL